jgi:hypothetical protein
VLPPPEGDSQVASRHVTAGGDRREPPEKYKIIQIRRGDRNVKIRETIAETASP